MASIAKVTPFAAPPQEQPQTITQTQILLVLSLKNRARQLAEQIAEAEASIKTRLEAKAAVEPGAHTAKLVENSRRSVSWREVTERLADRLFGKGKGAPYADRVIEKTKPTTTVSLYLG